MTGCFISSFEVAVVVVDLVGCFLLPVLDGLLGLAVGFCLVHVFYVLVVDLIADGAGGF